MKYVIKIITVICTISLFASTLISCSNMKDNSKIVRVFNCGEYIDEQLITKFESETGYTVQYNTYDTNEIMYSKIKSGSSTYDVAFPSDYMIEKMASEGMLAELNYDNIPNFKYIDDKYKNLDYDPDNKYTVPYMWGTVGIIYNSNEIKENVDSWDILWNKKYKNEIIMFDSIRDTIGISLIREGYSLNSTNQKHITKAANSLIKQKPLVKAYFVDQVKDSLLNKDALLATVYSGDANFLMNIDDSFKYVIPKEGSNMWFDCMVVPKNAKNKEGAEAFINFLTDPENSKINVDYIEYYTPNKKTFEMLDPEVQATYPTDEDLKNCEIFKMLDDDVLELYDEEWSRIGSS